MGEWKCTQSAVTRADRAVVWLYWTDLDNHAELEAPYVERIELDGPFVTGTTGRTITADYEQEWKLIDVVERKRFGIQGFTPDRRGTLTFAWDLEDEGDGTRIEYRIEAQGPDVEHQMAELRGLESNAPKGLAALVDTLDELPSHKQ